jgi:16S rRNA (cytidine1402-2'-O)-methyltransferase
MPGTLFVVATPIGNLEDLTFRALRTLRQVDVIAAEDTRRTSKLLSHYEIRKPLVSLREHNEVRETPRLVDRLRHGQSIALVSDAGTPGIADPGARLVQAARDAQIPVSPIPGPSAVTAALSVSGLELHEFVFMGFPPPAGSARREWMDRLAHEARAVVTFEAPHRIHRTLVELQHNLVNRPIQVHRELTKIHEQLDERPNSTSVRAEGEFVLVISPRTRHSDKVESTVKATSLLGRLTECGRFDREEMVELAASVSHLPARDVNKILKKHLISVKRQSDSTG